MSWYSRLKLMGIVAPSLAVTAWTKVPRLHPVPEYEPVKSVILSADLFAADYHVEELLTALVAAKAQVLIATSSPQSPAALKATLVGQGIPSVVARHVHSIELPHGNIWLRDYGPLALRSAAGEVQLADLIYDDPAAKMNDAFPLAVGRALSLPVRSVPFQLDLGNLLTNGEICFTSEQEQPKTKDTGQPEWLTRLGCKTTVVIHGAPHAHLDMWAKIVNDHVVLVNELDARAVALASRAYGHLPPELETLRNVLNDKAAEFSKTMTVRRLPMPLPYRGAFRTFANAILVNGHAIVPSYRRYGWNYDDYPDQELEPYYEDRVREAYQGLGYQVHFINADALIYNGGAFHCVTSPIPSSISDFSRRRGP